MTRPQVSVIMAAYNGGRYISEAIASVCAQHFADWELIIVDDGSTDATAAIVNSVEDPRIRYIHQVNRGQAAARNRGIVSAQGQWLGFLDQDDLWLPEKLQLQLEVVRQEHVDVIFSDGYIFWDKAERKETVFATLHGRFSGAEMFRLLFEANRIPVLSALVKRCCFDEVKLDERKIVQNCDDYDLWLTLARNNVAFYGMPHRLVRYRMHHQQASGNLVQQRAAELTVLEKHSNCQLLSSGPKRIALRKAYYEYILARLNSGETRFSDDRMPGNRGGVHTQPLAFMQRLAARCWPNRFKGISRYLFWLEDRALAIQERLWREV